MKPIEELGISPTPWELDIGGSCCWVEARGGATVCSTAASETRDCEADTANTRLIAAAPGLYAALRECCEEAMGDNVPRCYACRKDKDGHCMAAVEKRCVVYAALEKAGGKE